MMKSDTVHFFQNVSQRVRVGMFALRNTCAKDTGDRELCAHAVRGCRNNCRQMRANVKTHVYVSPKGSGKLTVKLPWEAVSSQAVKKGTQ